MCHDLSLQQDKTAPFAPNRSHLPRLGRPHTIVTHQLRFYIQSKNPPSGEGPFHGDQLKYICQGQQEASVGFHLQAQR